MNEGEKMCSHCGKAVDTEQIFGAPESLYCPHCGGRVSDADKACPSCGRAINCTAPDCVPTEPKVTYDDGANLGFAFLGFIMPLVGLILYFVDFKNRPKRARCTGIASIIGFIFWFVLELVAAVAVALLPFILDFILRVLPYLLEAMFA